MNSNIQVNFEKNGGTNSLQYTFDSGCIEQNVTFTAQSTYDWLTITHTNNIVTFNAQAQAESAVDSRTARYDIYVGGIRCLYTIDITQSGGVPCTCDAFRPISLGSIAPSGATIGALIGSYTYIGIPQSCQANLITVVATSGDTPYPTFVAENGNIKLSSNIEALTPYDDGKVWKVEFRYNGTVCDELYLYQTEVLCDCEHVSDIISFTNLVRPFGDEDNLLIATADATCGIFSATCDSDMLSKSIDNVTYENRVKIVYDPITGTSAYVHVLPTTENRSCAITPYIKARTTGKLMECTNKLITIEQYNNYVPCENIPASSRPVQTSYSWDNVRKVYPDYDTTMYLPYENKLSGYEVNQHIYVVPKVTYAAEVEEYDISYYNHYTGYIDRWGAELPDPSVYASGYTENGHCRLKIFRGQYTKAVGLKIGFDIYANGEFCKESTFEGPNILLIPEGTCSSCAHQSFPLVESCYTYGIDGYERETSRINLLDEVIQYYYCSDTIIITAITASIITSSTPYEHDFSDYIDIDITSGDSVNGISAYTLTISANTTNEDFNYKIVYEIKNKYTDESCTEYISRCRTKKHNVCDNCVEVMKAYAEFPKNDSYATLCIPVGASDCGTPTWIYPDYGGLYFNLTSNCDNRYKIYMAVYDNSNQEVTATTTEFIGPNSNRVRVTTSQTYIQGRGWQPDNYGYFYGFTEGYYDGTNPGCNGTPADFSFEYRARIYDTQNNTYCESDKYEISGQRYISCDDPSCTTPTCDDVKNMPSDLTILLNDGVPTIEKDGYTCVRFPKEGGTISAYHMNDFYNGSRTYTGSGWCQGSFITFSASTTHQHSISCNYGTYSNRYTSIDITVGAAESTNYYGRGYTIDVRFYLTTQDGRAECGRYYKQLNIWQDGIKEN